MYLHWIMIKNLFLLLNSLDLVSTVKERWRKGWWQFSWNFQSVSSSQISLILTLPRLDQRPLKEPGGAATNYRLTYSPHGRFSEGPYKPNWTEEPRHFFEGHYPLAKETQTWHWINSYRHEYFIFNLLYVGIEELWLAASSHMII